MPENTATSGLSALPIAGLAKAPLEESSQHCRPLQTRPPTLPGVSSSAATCRSSLSNGYDTLRSAQRRADLKSSCQNRLTALSRYAPAGELAPHQHSSAPLKKARGAWP